MDTILTQAWHAMISLGREADQVHQKLNSLTGLGWEPFKLNGYRVYRATLDNWEAAYAVGKVLNETLYQDHEPFYTDGSHIYAHLSETRDLRHRHDLDFTGLAGTVANAIANVDHTRRNRGSLRAAIL